MLLATSEDDRVLMLDPEDGRFLGYFNPQLPRERRAWYGVATQLVTQGPDQCIWMASTNNGDLPLDERDPTSSALAVARFDTEGKYLDSVIPRHRTEASGEKDLARAVRTIGFSEKEVYVSARTGVYRYTLDGVLIDQVLAMPASALLPTPAGLVYASDQSISLLAGGQTSTLQSGIRGTQLWYAGNGALLVSSGSEMSGMRLGLEGRAPTTWRAPLQAKSGGLSGVASLRNGKLLATGSGDIATFAESADMPSADSDFADQKRVGISGSHQIGRACLSEEFLRARAPRPPVTDCRIPDGPAIFEEHFSDGQVVDNAYHGFTIAPPQPAADTKNTKLALIGSGESRALRLTAPLGSNYNDVVQTLPPSQPSLISFRFKVPLNVLSNETRVDFGQYYNGGAPDSIFMFSTSFLNTLWLNTIFGPIFAGESVASGVTSLPHVQPGTWHQVQFRDIDWADHTFDLYLDCQRIGARARFDVDATAVDRIYIAANGGFITVDDIVMK